MKKQIQRNIPTLALALVIGFSVIYYLLIFIPANEKRVWSGGVRQLNTMAKNTSELFHAYNDAIIAARGKTTYLDASLIAAPANATAEIKNSSNVFYIVFPGYFGDSTETKSRHQDNAPTHRMKNFQDFVNLVEDFSFFEDIIILDANPNSEEKGRVLNHSRLSLSEYTIPDSLLSAGVKIYKTEIPPNSYYAFQRRIDLDGIHLHMIGLIAKSTFDKRTRQVDPTITIFFLLGVFLLILAWPVLKLLLITKHERLSTADVQLTNYAVIMGAAFITMLVGGAYIFLISQPSKTDAILQDLSSDIFKQFRKEIWERRVVLYSANLFDSVDSNCKGQKEFNFNYNEAFSVEPEEGMVLRLLTEPDNHKFDSFKPNSVDVKTRPYYTRLKLPAEKEILNTFYIQSIKSRADGTQECAISIPYRNGSIPMEIRVITSHLPSVIDPVLPYNYGFAIFDSKGTVQFHNDARKVINENFLEECGNDIKLRSFMENNSNGYLSLDYGDQRCRAYFQPLQIGDWYLVTFSGKNHADTFASSTLSFSLASFGGILLYIILLHQLFRLDTTRFKVVKGRKFFYQWLNPVNISQGKLKFLTLFVAAIALLDLVWWFHGKSVTGTFLWVLLTVSITYLVVYRRLRILRTPKEWSTFESIVSGLILVWSVLFLVNGIVRKDGFAASMLLIGAMMLLAVGWTRTSKNTSEEFVSSAGDFSRYRLLLLSLLMVLAVLPSLFFFKDHLNHEKIVRARKAFITEIRQLHPTTIEGIVAKKKTCNYDSTNLVQGLRKSAVENKPNPYFALTDAWFYNRTINYFGRDALQHRGLVLAIDTSGWQFSHDMNQIYAKIPPPLFAPDNPPAPQAYASLKMSGFSLNFSTVKDSILLVGIVTLLIIGLWRLIFEIIRRIFYLPLYCKFNLPQNVPGEVSLVKRSVPDTIHAFDNTTKAKNPIKADGSVLLSDRLHEYESELPYKHVEIELLPTSYNEDVAIFELNTFTTERASLHYLKKEWNSLSDDAKYFLYDLAEDGIVNQFDTKVIYELSRKRFIRLMPLEIVHPALTHFIMETTNIEYLREMKAKSGAEGRWNHFKIPFGLLIIAILGFLSMVEENLFARISALLASIGFILPGLIEVVSSWPKLWPGRKG